ncbi:MAG: PH domain-containing protein [Candidatus Paceibacterota bacterium]
MAKIDRLTEKAKEHLDPNETIEAIVMGAYETEILGADSVRNGIIIATNKRLVFYAKKLMGYELEDFPLSNISSIESGKNMMGHTISFFVSGNKVKMKWISNGEIKKFVDFVSSKIGKESTNIELPENGIPDQIEKLSKLREQGILTDEEFQTKKIDLLSRL